VPLDIADILHTPQGKPRVAIFSIAHLGDSERMFFVSLLLNQVLGWMRTQPGTGSLRALLYMDEIFGYFPPVQNPPSKLPFLTLLKQARAFGLGVILATQNPVDLDYKGLSNAGAWFVGRLQTERDKARLMDGLEGAAASTGGVFDRGRMEQTIAGLGNRVFLMNDSHLDAPVVFQTRWSLSYLRGPLTRAQIKQLMDPVKGQMLQAPAAQAGPPVATVGTAAAVPAVTARTARPAATPGAAAGLQPTLPPDVAQFFVPARGRAAAGQSLLYQPMVVGTAKVRFLDAKSKANVSQNAVYVTSITNTAVPVNWEDGQEASFALGDLEKTAGRGAQFADMPTEAGKAKNYTAWGRDFANWLYGMQKLDLLRSPSTGQFANPGESERDFRVRLQQTFREQRDQQVTALRNKYAPKIAALQEKIRHAQDAVDREAAQAHQAEMQTAISIGSTLLGAFLGGRSSRSTFGRASTAARGVSRSMGQMSDVGRAKRDMQAYQQQLNDLQTQFNDETAALQARIDPQNEQLETVTIRPKKTDVTVQLTALLWAPFWQDAQGNIAQAW